jgi:hypothetical protein
MLVLPSVVENSFLQKEAFAFEAYGMGKCALEKACGEREQSALGSDTVIIFDWDDTLLSTTYLNNLHDGKISDATEAYLQSIEKDAYVLLEMALELGHTFIITNATEGWVEDSASCCMPSLLPLLAQVQIISARRMQEHIYPGDAREWKVQSFLELGRRLRPGAITNLISIGDSSYELDAAHELGMLFGCEFIKTVKLQEKPSPMEHAKELGLLIHKFRAIVKKPRNLNVKLEWRSVNPK